jgi:protein-S-isoprenylcysteine O-methyltransferase Ste14
MGINKNEKIQVVTSGPYRFVRHPIYVSQLLMVAAIPVLLPSMLSAVILAVHFVCIFIKAADEDAFLLTIGSPEYQAYRTRTGGLFPRLIGNPPPAARSREKNDGASRPAGRDTK